MSSERICAECHAMLDEAGEYHPYAFCVLRKAGLNPLDVVTEAMRALAPSGNRWRLVRDLPSAIAEAP